MKTFDWRGILFDYENKPIIKVNKIFIMSSNLFFNWLSVFCDETWFDEHELNRTKVLRKG